jgi:F-type H+-transporting ATPase subunit delta
MDAGPGVRVGTQTLAADSSSISGVAGRYATALFELALDAGALDAVLADFATIETLLADSADLDRLVGSPAFSRDEQSRALDAVLAKAGAHDLVRRFLGVVARNRRLFTLRSIIQGFRTLVANHRGELVARVETAAPLSGGQIDALKTALSGAVKAKVDLDIWINPALIGGLKVQVGSRLVDASLKTKLNNLKNAMKGVG